MVALIAAIVCAVAGVVALVAAIIVGNTLLAAIAVGIAIIGLILLSRDWLKQRDIGKTDHAADEEEDERNARSDDALKPEMFAPDVSYEEAVQHADDAEDFDLEGDGAG